MMSKLEAAIKKIEAETKAESKVLRLMGKMHPEEILEVVTQELIEEGFDADLAETVTYNFITAEIGA